MVKKLRALLVAAMASGLLALALYASESGTLPAYAATQVATWTAEPANAGSQGSGVTSNFTPWPTPKIRTNNRLNERFGDNFVDIKSGTWWLVVAVVAGITFTRAFKNVLVGVVSVVMVLVAATFIHPPEFLTDGLVDTAGLPVMPLILTLVAAIALTGIFAFVRRK